MAGGGAARRRQARRATATWPRSASATPSAPTTGNANLTDVESALPVDSVAVVVDPIFSQHFSKLTVRAVTPSAMILRFSPTVRVEEIDGCSSNGGRAKRARPAREDFRGVHGPDPESRRRARSTREVAHLLRRQGRRSRPALAEIFVQHRGRGHPLEL